MQNDKIISQIIQKPNERTEKMKQNNFGKMNRGRNIQWNLMTAVPLILVFIFSYLPLVGLTIAFKNYKFNKGIFGSDWVGLKHFKSFMRSNDFFRITRNTLSLNLVFIVVGIAAAVALAIFLYNLRSSRAVKTYQTILMTPNFISWVIVGYMVYALLNPQYGIVNGVLKVVGLQGVDWYSTPEAWPVILTIANVWKHIGMDAIYYYATLMSLDYSLMEAAEIDGASYMRKVWSIIIPCLIPTMTTLAILKVGSIFRADFGLFYQLPRDVGTLYSTTDVIDTYIYRTMRVVGDMSLSTAVGFLQSIVCACLVLLTNYITKRVDDNLSLF